MIMIEKILQYLITLLEGLQDSERRRIFGGVRSSQWPAVRKNFLMENPVCEICFSRKNINVHHKVPVHIDKTKELLNTNLVTLCRECHWIFAHYKSWHSYSTDLDKDILIWRQKITSRP